MYKIIATDGAEIGVTDSVLFIKISAEGTYIEADKSEAVGIAFKGVAYNLPGHTEVKDAKTVCLAPITLAEFLQEQTEKTARMQANVDYLAMMSDVDFEADADETREEVDE